MSIPASSFKLVAIEEASRVLTISCEDYVHNPDHLADNNMLVRTCISKLLTNLSFDSLEYPQDGAIKRMVYVSHLEEINGYIAHKMKLETTLTGKLPSQGREQLSGWNQQDFLLSHLYFTIGEFFKVKHVMRRDDRVSADFPAVTRPEIFLTALLREIYITLNAFSIVVKCLSLSVSGISHFVREFLSELSTAFASKETETKRFVENIIFPCGTKRHAVYLNFIRTADKKWASVRIDNLGIGHEKYHSLERDEKTDEMKGVYTRRIANISTSVLKEHLPLALYLEKVIKFSHTMSTNKDDFKVLYNEGSEATLVESKGVCELNTKDDIGKSVAHAPQTINNCVTKNFFVGAFYRLGHVGRLENSHVYDWLINKECQFIYTVHTDNQNLTEDQKQEELRRLDETLAVMSASDRKQSISSLSNDDIDTEIKSYENCPYFHVIQINRNNTVLPIDQSIRRCFESTENWCAAVLHGESGMGKTESALFYCKKMASWYNQRIYYLDAENIAVFDKSLRDLYRMYKIASFYGTTDKMIDRTIKAICGEKQRVLIVLDNLDEDEMRDKQIVPFLETLRSMSSLRHHVIITSVKSDWSTSDWEMERFPIGGFYVSKDGKIDQAKDYIYQVLKGEHEVSTEKANSEFENMVNRLINLHDRVPLLLSQAVSFIRTHGISEYIRSYNQNWENRKTLLNSQSVFSGKYKKQMYTSWLTRVKLVETELGNTDKLISGIGFVDPNNIPVELVSKFIAISGLEDQKLRQIVRTMKDQSIIHVNIITSSIRIHRMLQEVIRIDLQLNQIYHQNLNDVLIRADAAFTYNYYDVATYKAANDLYIHIKSILNYMIQEESKCNMELWCKTMARITMYEVQILGEFQIAEKARIYIWEYYKRNERRYEELVSLIDLVSVISSEFRFKQVEEYCYKALKLTTESDQLLIAEINVYLAQTKQVRGRLPEAIAIFEDSLRIFEAEDRDDPSPANKTNITRCISFLCATLRKYEGPWSGKYSDRDATLKIAITKLEHNLEIYSGLCGRDHDAYAKTLAHLAHTYDDLGDFETAKTYYNQALQTRRSRLGANHPWAAWSIYEYTLTLIALGEKTVALEKLNEAKAIIDYNTYIGNITYYIHLAEFYIQDSLNEKSRAEECLKAVIEGFNQIDRGCIPVETFRYEVSWKKPWSDLCRSDDKQLGYYEEITALLKKIYGKSHPEIANCYRRIGLVHIGKSEKSKAAGSFQSAVRIMKSIPNINLQNDLNYQKLISDIKTHWQYSGYYRFHL